MALTGTPQLVFEPESPLVIGNTCKGRSQNAAENPSVPAQYRKLQWRITMTKILLLAIALVGSAAWLQAQDQYGSQSSSSQTAAASAGKTTVQGCLQSSNGAYTLTDKSGTTYQLQGDASKLSAHVGHEVKITGTTSSSSATSSSMGAPTGGTQQPMLTVESMKHISKTCQAPGK